MNPFALLIAGLLLLAMILFAIPGGIVLIFKRMARRPANDEFVEQARKQREGR